MNTTRLKRVGQGAALLGVGFALGMVAGTPGLVDAEPRPNPYARLTTFAKVASYIERSYVDPVAQSDLIDAAIKGMVSSLDPHSAYYSPNEYAELRKEAEGDFIGVGLELSVREGSVVVVAPIEGAPAEKAGVRSGDVISAIDGVAIRGWTLRETVRALRGKAGSSVQLGLFRPDGKGGGQDVTLSMSRKPVSRDAVTREMMGSDLGYIRIRAFQEGAAVDVESAIEAFSETAAGPPRGLIIDLRNNPGGFLLEAVRTADLLLDTGVIVTTRSRSVQAAESFKAQRGATIFQGPVALLINGGSASSSEILAGALSDHGRAVLVGTRTFGKGSVQTIVDMKDGSALKLTTARYFTPSGTSIQDTGISPDIEVEDRTSGGDAALSMAQAHLRSLIGASD